MPVVESPVNHEGICLLKGMREEVIVAMSCSQVSNISST